MLNENIKEYYKGKLFEEVYRQSLQEASYDLNDIKQIFGAAGKRIKRFFGQPVQDGVPEIWRQIPKIYRHMRQVIRRSSTGPGGAIRRVFDMDTLQHFNRGGIVQEIIVHTNEAGEEITSRVWHYFRNIPDPLNLTGGAYDAGGRVPQTTRRFKMPAKWTPEDGIPPNILQNIFEYMETYRRELRKLGYQEDDIRDIIASMDQQITGEFAVAAHTGHSTMDINSDQLSDMEGSTEFDTGDDAVASTRPSGPYA